MTQNEAWQGLLDSDEEILWQGAPKAQLRMEFDSPFHIFFFLFFTGFSIFWIVMASAAGGYFWTFGLLFFGVGSYNLVGIHFWKMFARKNTFYTLTDRRAIIARDMFGRKTFKSYPITEASPLDLEIRDGLSDIYFATEYQKGRRGALQSIRKGFEQLEDGRSVMSLMRDVQRKHGDTS